MKYYFSSESVTAGHPDKICDQISDAILDEALRHDAFSKMAVECTIKDNFILIYGEANTTASIPYETIAKRVVKDIGYLEEFEVCVKVSQQSSEIAQAVSSNEELGAGDQGIIFGYACNETASYMPLSIDLAHKLAKRLEVVYKTEANSLLRPDGKTQVTVEYENGQINRVDTIVVSSQHVDNISQDELRSYLRTNVIDEVVDKELVDENTKYIINPSGSFVVGGPFGDSGTTGRKIVVDTYGGHSRIGGGCFSSKDATKVDRSAAYYCRYVAKNVVANKLADKCEIQVSYAIGLSKPLSIFVETFGTNKVDIAAIHSFIDKHFDFSVDNIINELNLRQPIYQQTATYGHFGRTDLDLPWENIRKL